MAQSCLVDGSQEMLATADAFRGRKRCCRVHKRRRSATAATSDKKPSCRRHLEIVRVTTGAQRDAEPTRTQRHSHRHRELFTGRRNARTHKVTVQQPRIVVILKYVQYCTRLNPHARARRGPHTSQEHDTQEQDIKG